MDNAFEKIGVISYKKSKYANWFIVGNFVFFLAIGIIAILASDSFSHNRLNGAWCLLGCLGYIVLHEIVHLMFMRLFSKNALHFSIQFPTISVGSSAKYRKLQFIVIALAPAVLLGIFLTIMLALSAKEHAFFWAMLLTLNFAGSGGDYLQVFATRKYPASTFFQDNSVETAVYKKK